MDQYRNKNLGFWVAVLMVTSAMAGTVHLPDRQIDKCATVLCPTDTECKVVDGAPTCIPIPPGGACGPSTCAKGLECCNPSCGICTKPGQGCTKQACLGPPCGRKTCPFGEKCCNKSCGYCVKPGQKCTMELCLPIN
ncbi:hypothetical protein QBC43DRAFT_331542 [Cladorrhinum sp. PSN259]|nr:hypothetical protein QBC43DRAFT_331542 [Cladorrhinum sp. PSN259]